MVTERRKDLAGIQRRLLRQAGEDAPRYDFFSSLLEEVMEFSGCSTASLLLSDHERLTRWEADSTSRARLRIASLAEDAAAADGRSRGTPFQDLCLAVLLGNAPTHRGKRTQEGAYFDEAWPIPGRPHGRFVTSSVAVMPLSNAGSEQRAVLGLRMPEPTHFEAEEVGMLLGLAEAVAVGVTHHLLQWALQERVKELTCLYGISRVAERTDIPEDIALQRVVELIPSGWQYPEIASAAISLDGRMVAVSGSGEGLCRLLADLRVGGQCRGTIEVMYGEERPEYDEGPFLREERRLLEEVARQVGLMLEGRQAAKERARLQEQFREAERLATIGRLAAGTAHELNEPLGAILGFAQLARKQPRVPAPVGRDLDSIVKASLHAREVIRKLLLFSRQTPFRKVAVAINPIIRDALLLLRGRLEDRSIKVQRHLARSLPRILADPAQIQQVFINLFVNALQAMPRGGSLRIETSSADTTVVVVVGDTGVGMSEEVAQHAFMPFFTTKDVGQGTGLGLSVVHGIVTAHGGTVGVQSDAGRGTAVSVTFPAVTDDSPRMDSPRNDSPRNDSPRNDSRNDSPRNDPRNDSPRKTSRRRGAHGRQE